MVLTWIRIHAGDVAQAKLDKAENKTNASTNADVPGSESSFNSGR